MPTTIDRPTKSTAAVPSYPGLAIDAPYPLSGDVGKALATYHGDCCKFEDDESELQESRLRVLDSSLAKVLRETVDAGPKLNESRGRLEIILTELRWRRRNLLPQLIPGCKANIADAERKRDEAEATVRADWAERGITERAMPGWPGNQAAAVHQLSFRLKQEPEYLAAQDAFNRAQSLLTVLESQLANLPRPKQCAIRWRPVRDEVQAAVAQLAGIDSDAPSMNTPPEFSARERRVLREVGLTGAALLPVHVALVRQLAELLNNDLYRPLHAATPKQLPAVRELLSKFPQTTEVADYLRATAKGPAHFVV